MRLSERLWLWTTYVSALAVCALLLWKAVEPLVR